ncbi:ferrochelatase [Kocuria sp.]|uniref:ferrochelatase n=1 Tax=Kocuria sp. TaxID=1871328 RepID=UPI0026E044B7|nr:ferrochelatase [Kocuria sp.]MDO5366919.1 ferrochelatase [Kocuria sp.]
MTPTDQQTTNALSAARAAEPRPFDAVILSSFGGPEGQDDVIPFLRNVTRGRGIPDERLEEVATHYRANGGVSPINAQNRALRDALEAELRRRGVTVPLLWANRNWAPYVADVLTECHDRGYKDLLILATSAFSGYSSCRQYREDYGMGLEKLGLTDTLHVEKVRPYFDEIGFLTPSVDGLRDALAALRERVGESTLEVLFTTHSVPDTDAHASGSERIEFEENSAYVAQHLAASRWIVAQLGDAMDNVNWQLVYQSRSGPPQIPWLEPDICDVIETLPESGVRGVAVVPVGFVSDHMEVMWDLDTEAKDAAAEAGIAFERVATAGTHPAFVGALADAIEQRLGTETAPPRVSACGQGTWFDNCPADCCKKILRGQSAPRPTVAQTPLDQPIAVGMDDQGEVMYR